MSIVEFLESQKSKHPEIGLLYDELINYDQRKLWHQLTLTLEKLVSAPCFSTGDDLIQLYHRFIIKFEKKLNPTKLVLIILVVSKQYTESLQAIEFVSSIAAKVSSDVEAHTLCQMEIALLHLKMGEVDQCKKIVEDAQAVLSKIAEVDSIVNSSFYHVNSLLHRFLGNAAEFYTNSLLYLAYTQLEVLAPEQRVSLAFDLSIAALCGEKIYQFGELLLHPILQSLEATPQAWMCALLRAFSRGDISEFEQIAQVNQAELNALPVLVQNSKKLREKIRIFALMELIRDLPADNRVISFSSIAQRCSVEEDAVEMLVMKALSLELVKGNIDEIEYTVRVTWVQPRVLEIAAISKMADRLSDWISKVKETTIFLDNETPELLA